MDRRFLRAVIIKGQTSPTALSNAILATDVASMLAQNAPSYKKTPARALRCTRLQLYATTLLSKTAIANVKAPSTLRQSKQHSSDACHHCHKDPPLRLLLCVISTEPEARSSASSTYSAPPALSCRQPLQAHQAPRIGTHKLDRTTGT